MDVFGGIIQPTYLLLDNAIWSTPWMFSKSEKMPNAVLDKKAEMVRSLY